MRPDYEFYSKHDNILYNDTPVDDRTNKYLPLTTYGMPAFSRDTYVILNPRWIEALAESKERRWAAENYLEDRFEHYCDQVEIEWNEDISAYTFVLTSF
jgi:hypothetical protein